MSPEAITFSDGGSKNIFQSNEINDGRLSSLLKNALSKPAETVISQKQGGGWLLKMRRVKKLTVTHT